MADKLTLLELHLHAEGNEFESDMEFSSDIGDILRRRFGFGESDEETEFGTDDETESLTAPGTTADGGDTVELDDEETETETGSAVVEIDPDADLEEDIDDEFDVEEDEDESGGRSVGRSLLMLIVLAGFAFLVRQYLSGDDLDDEFEEL